MLIRLFLIISLFSILSCASPRNSLSTCDGLDKVSKQYIQCLEDLVNSTNTALNIKEFKKHKNAASFLKRVNVNPSD